MRDDRYKWWLLAFLFVTFLLELGSRHLYNAALPQIRLDFRSMGVTDLQLGLVGTVFSTVFGLALMLSGMAADFFGRKRVIVLGTLVFSSAIIGTGFAASLGAVCLFYGVLNALGQCCIAPPCYSLISQHHVRTRSTAMAIFQCAVYAGAILASVFAGLLADSGAGGWRKAFWLFGATGIVWAALMQRGMRDTPPPAAQGEKPSVKEAFLALLTKPTAMLIAVGFGFYQYAVLGFRLWMPVFIVRAFPDTSVAGAAFHAVFWQCLGSFCGLSVTARLVDRWVVRHPRARLDVSILGLFLCALPIVWVSRAGSLAECAVALFALGLANGIYDAAHYPAMHDCIVPRYRSAATGLTGAFAFVFGAMGPTVLGWMSDRLSMRTGLLSLSFFFVTGALVLLPGALRYFDRDYVKDA